MSVWENALKRSRLGTALAVAGSCIAFYIGAGFATMQELMQYEVSYGSLFWIVILVTAIIYKYTNFSFASMGNRLQIVRGGDVYKSYCGKYIGTVFDWFSAFFCYMCFIVMCGGANSTAIQQWGLSNGVGAVVLTVAVIAAVIFALNGIVKTLGKVGPIIICCIFVIAAMTIASNWAALPAGFEAIDNEKYQIVQVGEGNPFSSGASYGGFVILWFAALLSEIGARNKLKPVNIGMLLSALCIFAVAGLCCAALVSDINVTWSADIPALVLATAIHPVFGQFFALVIYLGIFTSAVPLLWTGVSKITHDGSTGYKTLTVVGGTIGCLIACWFPYAELINVLYGINGYLGFILIGFMIIADIKRFVMRHRSKVE